jgi:F1F0 ATPase subunit 2
MDDIIYMVLTLFAGFLLGIVFFGGLWYTVQKAVASNAAGLWFIFSFIFRVSITLIGFYYISSGQWQRLLSCLFGFIIARITVARLTVKYKNQVRFKKEVYHED